MLLPVCRVGATGPRNPSDASQELRFHAPIRSMSTVEIGPTVFTFVLSPVQPGGLKDGYYRLIPGLLQAAVLSSR